MVVNQTISPGWTGPIKTFVTSDIEVESLPRYRLWLHLVLSMQDSVSCLREVCVKHQQTHFITKQVTVAATATTTTTTTTTAKHQLQHNQ